MRLAAAVKWYEMGVVSQEKAAEIAGLTRADFIFSLARFGVSPFQSSAEEITKICAMLINRVVVNASRLSVCLRATSQSYCLHCLRMSLS